MEANTNECPYCIGNGFLFQPGGPLLECPKCSGSGILSDSELAELLESEKE